MEKTLFSAQGRELFCVKPETVRCNRLRTEHSTVQPLRVKLPVEVIVEVVVLQHSTLS